MFKYTFSYKMVHLRYFYKSTPKFKKNVNFSFFKTKITKNKTNDKTVNSYTNNVIKYLSRIYALTSFPVKITFSNYS